MLWRKFGESSEKILKLIYEKPTTSAAEMADKIGISDRAVEKHLANLKEKKIIDRAGSARGGYWKLNL